MRQQLTIDHRQRQKMLQHAEDHLPLEACGLLAGRDGRVEQVIGVRNQARSAVRFVMDPREQLEAFDRIESSGLDLLAIFHSHPGGPETLSATDVAEAAYDVVHIVCSRSGREWKVRGFWIEDGQPREVELRAS